MNKLILCEGATDAILLSYYLERTAGWKFVRQPPQGVSIRATEQNEEVTWYKKNNDYLLICAVGGKDNSLTIKFKNRSLCQMPLRRSPL